MPGNQPPPPWSNFGHQVARESCLAQAAVLRAALLLCGSSLTFVPYSYPTLPCYPLFFGLFTQKAHFFSCFCFGFSSPHLPDRFFLDLNLFFFRAVACCRFPSRAPLKPLQPQFFLLRVPSTTGLPGTRLCAGNVFPRLSFKTRPVRNLEPQCSPPIKVFSTPLSQVFFISASQTLSPEPPAGFHRSVLCVLLWCAFFLVDYWVKLKPQCPVRSAATLRRPFNCHFSLPPLPLLLFRFLRPTTSFGVRHGFLPLSANGVMSLVAAHMFPDRLTPCPFFCSIAALNKDVLVLGAANSSAGCPAGLPLPPFFFFCFCPHFAAQLLALFLFVSAFSGPLR